MTLVDSVLIVGGEVVVVGRTPRAAAALGAGCAGPPSIAKPITPSSSPSGTPTASQERPGRREPRGIGPRGRTSSCSMDMVLQSEGETHPAPPGTRRYLAR